LSSCNLCCGQVTRIDRMDLRYFVLPVSIQEISTETKDNNNEDEFGNIKGDQ